MQSFILVLAKGGIITKAVMFGSFGEPYKGHNVIIYNRDTANLNLFVVKSLEKVYEMGAFHFGHSDRGVIIVSLVDSGPLG